MMRKTLWNLMDLSEDLATAVNDLMESINVAESTWEVLGDPSAFAGMSDDEMIAEWENDLHAAVMQEQWVLGYADEVQKFMGDLVTQWVNFNALTA